MDLHKFSPPVKTWRHHILMEGFTLSKDGAMRVQGFFVACSTAFPLVMKARFATREEALARLNELNKKGCPSGYHGNN